MRLQLALFLTLALVLGPATFASAAPDFSGTLSAETPKYTWESSGSGAPEITGEARCTGGPFHCEYILLDVKAAGGLQLTLDSTEGVDGPSDPTGEAPLASAQDIDGYLYKSNAAGEPQGDALTNGDDPAADCVTSHASETCKIAVEPGFYVLEVEFFAALEAPYTGTAELIGAAPATPPATPPATGPPPSPPAQPPAQQPASQPASQPAPAPKPATTKKKAKKKKSSRTACKKKARKIKNAKKRKKALKRCARKRKR